ncbi:hypothetical protein CAL7716_085170 [Calothrix sp. PCC 7716]|nr:hypothetical protein CAL7716_085170 [Calothrix sp. PCC 7716]
MSENNFDDEAKKQAEEEKKAKDEKEAKQFLLGLFGFMVLITIASNIYRAFNPPKELEVVTATKTEVPKRDNEEATLDQDCVNRVTQEIADRENDDGDGYINKEEAIKYTFEIAQRCRK